MAQRGRDALGNRAESSRAAGPPSKPHTGSRMLSSQRLGCPARRSGLVSVLTASSVLVVALASPVSAADVPVDGDAQNDFGADEELILDEEGESNTGISLIPPPRKGDYVRFDAALDTAFVVGSEFGDTEVSEARSRVTLEAGAPLSKFVAVGVRARFGVLGTQFDGDGQFLQAGRPGSEPFDELLTSSIAIGSRIRLIEGLDMEMVALGISRIEVGARFASGLEGAGSVSLLGQYRDRIVLRLGVGVRSNFDDSEAHVSPVFRLRVRLHERLWAETGGRNGRLEFTASEAVRIDLFGGVDGDRYRLENRRDGPDGVGQGSLRIRRTGLGLGTRIDLLKELRLVVEAGVVLTQTLEIRDEDGDTFDKRETREPAFRGRVALKWRF
jgi:hypothetical protein